jgi:predicted nucleic acid-binding Zn finger protein
MKKLYNFLQYSAYKTLNEDGYGKEPFFYAKDGKSHYYYFKIKAEGGIQAYYIQIGKNTDYLNIGDAENSYCVCSLFRVDPDELDDYLVRERKSSLKHEGQFDITEESLGKIWNTFFLVIEDYLDKNPKVNKVYDEFPLSFSNNFQYKNFIENMLKMDEAPRWSVQNTSEPKILLYTKKDHK